MRKENLMETRKELTREKWRVGQMAEMWVEQMVAYLADRLEALPVAGKENMLVGWKVVMKGLWKALQTVGYWGTTKVDPTELNSGERKAGRTDEWLADKREPWKVVSKDALRVVSLDMKKGEMKADQWELKKGRKMVQLMESMLAELLDKRSVG